MTYRNSFPLFFVFLWLFLPRASAQKQRHHQMQFGIQEKIKNNSKVDITTLGGIKYYLTNIDFNGKRVKILSTFKKTEKDDPFNRFTMNGYLATYIIVNKDTIKNIQTFDSLICVRKELKLPSLYQGAEIDNPDGFYINSIRDSSFSYAVLIGYYLGCNGSFCNNGFCLVLRFEANHLANAFTFGFDRTLVQANSLKLACSNAKLILTLPLNKENNSKKIDCAIIDFDLRMQLDKRMKNYALRDLGLFCNLSK